MKKFLFVSALFLIILSSCHTKGRLLVSDDLNAPGSWILHADTLCSVVLEDGLLKLDGDAISPYSGNYAGAQLYFDSENAKKICVQVEYEKYNIWMDDGYHGGEGSATIIQSGGYMLVPNHSSLTGDLLYESLAGKTVHYEINVKRGTYKVTSDKEDFSRFYSLIKANSDNSYLKFTCKYAELPSIGSGVPSHIEINSVKIYRLR